MTTRLPKKWREKALALAKRFHTNVPDILGSTRGSPKTSEARQALMYSMRINGLTYAQIGAYLDRDRKTVSWGVAQHKARSI